MKIAFRLFLMALVFTVVSCGGEATQEPVAPAPVQAAPVETAPAAQKKEEPKTKVDIKVNTKDGSVGVDVESKK